MSKDSSLSMGLKLVSFLIPIVGLIIYFAKKKENPAGAKVALQYTLAGFAVAIIGIVINGLGS